LVFSRLQHMLLRRLDAIRSILEPNSRKTCAQAAPSNLASSLRVDNCLGGMFLATVSSLIEDVANTVPSFRANRSDVRQLAGRLAEMYLKQVDYAGTLFPRDIALAAIHLACTQLGPRLSFTELAREANTDLTAWPSVEDDMRRRLGGLI